MADKGFDPSEFYVRYRKLADSATRPSEPARAMWEYRDHKLIDDELRIRPNRHVPLQALQSLREILDEDGDEDVRFSYSAWLSHVHGARPKPMLAPCLEQRLHYVQEIFEYLEDKYPELTLDKIERGLHQFAPVRYLMNRSFEAGMEFAYFLVEKRLGDAISTGRRTGANAGRKGGSQTARKTRVWPEYLRAMRAHVRDNPNASFADALSAVCLNEGWEPDAVRKALQRQGMKAGNFHEWIHPDDI